MRARIRYLLATTAIATVAVMAVGGFALFNSDRLTLAQLQDPDVVETAPTETSAAAASEPDAAAVTAPESPASKADAEHEGPIQQSVFDLFAPREPVNDTATVDEAPVYPEDETFEFVTEDVEGETDAEMTDVVDEDCEPIFSEDGVIVDTCSEEPLY